MPQILGIGALAGIGFTVSLFISDLAFDVPADTDRFMIGSGQVRARVNKLQLSNLRSDSGLVVLRYRYHPGWSTDYGGAVLRYPVEDDPAGFIALEHPPGRVVLEMEPVAMISEPWPEYFLPVGGSPATSMRPVDRLPDYQMTDE